MFANFYNEFKHQPLNFIFDLLGKDDSYRCQIMILKASFSSALSLIEFKLEGFKPYTESNIASVFDNKKIPLLERLAEISVSETVDLLKSIRHSCAHLYHKSKTFEVNQNLFEELKSCGLNTSYMFAELDKTINTKIHQITLFGAIVILSAFLSKLERVFFFNRLFDKSDQDIRMIREQIKNIPPVRNLKNNSEKQEARKLRYIYKFLTMPIMLLIYNIESCMYEINPSSIYNSSNNFPNLLKENKVKNQFVEAINLLRTSVLHGNFFGKEHSNYKKTTSIKDMLASVESIHSWELVSQNEHIKKYIISFLEELIEGKYYKLEAQMNYFRKHKQLKIKDLKLTNQIYRTIIKWHNDITEEDENAIFNLLCKYSNQKIVTREIYVYRNALEIKKTKSKKNTPKKIDLIVIGLVENYSHINGFSLNLSKDFKLLFNSKLTKIFSN